ncbi:muscarinic acetylcholine receptor DM1 isoform X2 [Condylostylus longicornis]|uniref:muscarinic acetylcholine receptor DM1 isoform X2 n=1 Tax=Condylostylus longicornis TaxID=2530218 RepID=UPI00244E161D|nr:muscarinic acetylcholine receptor DM1 isoform X2 [Condylostylus longicornis]
MMKSSIFIKEAVKNFNLNSILTTTMIIIILIGLNTNTIIIVNGLAESSALKSSGTSTRKSSSILVGSGAVNLIGSPNGITLTQNGLLAPSSSSSSSSSSTSSGSQSSSIGITSYTGTISGTSGTILNVGYGNEYHQINISSSTLMPDDITTEFINDTDINGTLSEEPPELRYTIPQMVILAIVAIILSILTVAGNVMVMISFKIDKQLQTISNYFLFSLAIADFAIGLISMPLFAVSTILGYWPLGPHICDTWLALDYLASNASVLNLLIISFDRYFSVTRPLTYRAKRTTTRAAIMISAAWGISLLLWPPWIYSWPYIEGKRTVPQYQCYIQFIETNQYITFGTALAAFYFPVTIMCFLYYRIWRETKKRQKDLPNLQAGKKDSSKRSNSSDENTAVNHSGGISHVGGSGNNEHEGWRRPRSESSADAESVYMTNAVLADSSYSHHGGTSGNSAGGGGGSNNNTGGGTGGGGGGAPSRKSSLSNANGLKKSHNCFSGIKEWCIAWWHSGREDSDDFGGVGYEHEEPSDLGCTSLNVIRDPYATNRPGMVSIIPDVSPSQPTSTTLRPQLPPLTQLQEIPGPRDSRSLPSNNSNRLGSRSVSQDSVYTILIRLPPDGGTGDERAPSIKMIHDDVPLPVMSVPPRRPLPSRDSEYSLPAINRRMSHATPDIRIPLNAKIIPKPLAKPPLTARQAKKKKKSQEKRQETKAAKTLSAILLSFILTWTPYNILVLIKPLTTCGAQCIPQELWDFFYALCYINSTINPVCYALCNASFRRTYVRILTCKWHTRNREALTRGVYN